MSFQYFAWLSEDKESVEDAREIARIWTRPDGHTVQERYTAESGWIGTQLVDDVQDLRKQGWLKTITQQDVDLYKVILARRLHRN
ncbi:hypothetical protein [Lentzea sp.]|uniref:hypothetical protein n=1 Tax=Lentzea sp. TaxID=56099 RepID=UPI002ED58E3F